MGKSNDRASMPPPAARTPPAARSKRSKVGYRDGALPTPRPRRNTTSTIASDVSGASIRSSQIATSALTFHSSGHGRMRRHQRNIRVRQLQAAMKHGRQTPSGVQGRSKYTYKGITFVVDDATKQEVTSYATPFDIPLKAISNSEWQAHIRARQAIEQNPPGYCNSHSVILVDISGSMRNSDVQGSRTRLAAVWFSIAEDFIKNRIQSGQAGLHDAISVILMGETAMLHPFVHNVPTDWVTYNAVLKIYKQGTVTPGGHGRYRPALSKAEAILAQYSSTNCALLLAIMSDGRPSDNGFDRMSYQAMETSLVELIASISSRLGKRLTVSAIGMGSENRFDTLKNMTDKAKEYESGGYFQLPSMSASSIGAAISSIATSLTDTQTALYTIDGLAGKPKRHIREVVRESRKAMPTITEVIDREDFYVFMGDDVSHRVFDPTMEGAEPFKSVPLQHPEARGVAIAKKAFGEGTERFAFQFFEVMADGVTVVGEPLVAKESKYVIEATKNSSDEMKKFVRRFCRIHHQANKAAEAFNAKMDSIRTLDSDTARVCFLPCSVYYLKDPKKGDMVIGVEHRLFGNFQKWNSNNGWKKSRRKRGPGAASQGQEPLASIPEESTGTAKDEEEDRDTARVINIDMDVDETLFVTQDEVAQAFSHFSYVFGGRKSLICDLQGVYDRQKRRLCFTDPVIHFHDVLKEDKRGQYGRTDRGEKGIDDFLHSHECNALCDIVTKGFMTVQSDKHWRRQRMDESL